MCVCVCVCVCVCLCVCAGERTGVVFVYTTIFLNRAVLEAYYLVVKTYGHEGSMT